MSCRSGASPSGHTLTIGVTNPTAAALPGGTTVCLYECHWNSEIAEAASSGESPFVVDSCGRRA
jgi:hypothetical protein